MENQPDMGFNRTGAATSPKLSAEMLEGIGEFPPNAPGDERLIASVREGYAKGSDKVGSVPPPLTVGGMASAAIQGIRGTRPVQFIDKLGERLGFERMGVRLYAALISKFQAFGGFDGGPSLAELESVMLDEQRHFRLLVDAVTETGGDPTVVTPSADVAATLSRGVLDVLVDPRTTFVQSLEAILVAELVDNDAWDALIALAQKRDNAGLTARFQAARADEARHLERVRGWLAAAQNRGDEA